MNNTTQLKKDTKNSHLWNLTLLRQVTLLCGHGEIELAKFNSIYTSEEKILQKITASELWDKLEEMDKWLCGIYHQNLI